MKNGRIFRDLEINLVKKERLDSEACFLKLNEWRNGYIHY